MNENDEDKIMYKVRVNNWFNNAMEFDKSILWISVIMIVLMVNIEQTSIGTVSILFLTTTIVSILRVFKLNSHYLHAVIEKETSKEELVNKQLKIWDNIVIGSFTGGILLSVIAYLMK